MDPSTRRPLLALAALSTLAVGLLALLCCGGLGTWGAVQLVHERTARRYLQLCAAVNADREATRRLLAEGYPTEPPPDGLTSTRHVAALTAAPLWVAAGAGDLLLVEDLLAHGADVHHQCCAAGTALHAAARAGHVAVVGVLMEHGARPDCQAAEGCTVNVARERGHLDVVHRLERLP